MPTPAPALALTAPATWPARAGLRRWAVAVTVYIAAVFNRTSLGVAGLRAAHRFGITPAQLSVFVLVQLGVYAAMQVPTGLLADRYGPRRLLIAAAATMALAQLVFAVTPSYPAALLARAILGCGDALTFVSVLRFAAQDFAPRRFPLAVAVTSMLGLGGNIVATIPLTLLLRSAGWTPTFAGVGVVSLATGVAAWSLLPAAGPAAGPRRRLRELRAPLAQVGRQVRAAWATPGTRLGFWVHFSCMSLTTMFAVLWGLPYLVAQGFSQSAASAVLLVGVLAAIVVSPPVGMIFGRFPAARVPFAISVCLVTVAGWSTLLGGFGGHPPHALIVAVVALSAVGGPASTIGFSLARDYNSHRVVGTASGVVNVGGFSATILASLLVGGVLDLIGRTDVPAYRFAFGCAVAVQVLGTASAVRWWLRVRGHVLRAQSRGEPVPVPLVRRQFDRVR
ncbi:MAG TPA: MFS transporter [Streptosporangiaceae bacterium]|nr:MFS transporter [Streptosporangiaceae bacterium]